jgi:hypothetical protein
LTASIFGPIVSLLQTLLDDFVCFIETGVVLFANLCIKGIGAIIAGLLAILPNMPSLSSVPSWAVSGYNAVAYFFPVDYALSLCATLLTLWVAWIGIAVVLRWARAIGGKA